MSFLISEWVMPYICRAELLFLFLRAAIDWPADVNSDSFGRISRLVANFCTKAAGTPGSLLLEQAPSKTGLGVDFVFLYWVILGGLGKPEHRLTCPFACVCDSKVSFSWKGLQGGCFLGYCPTITTWWTQLAIMYKSLLQLKGALLTVRLVLQLKGLTAKWFHCLGKRIGWFKWGH